jgi:hypothetical protein
MGRPLKGWESQKTYLRKGVISFADCRVWQTDLVEKRDIPGSSQIGPGIFFARTFNAT